MLALAVVAVGLQAVAMLVDELHFHRRRALPRWERIGHPLDTLTIAAALAWLVATRPTDPHALAGYLGLACFSTVFVTKDEWVHAAHCAPGEHWLHAVLFVLHPVVLAAFGWAWWTGHRALVGGQLALSGAVLAYQVLYWNVRRARPPRPPRPPRAIDNTWYAQLGARWYTADDTPIALLRAEARHRNPWLAAELERRRGPASRVLDLGCGGGLLANFLAARGHRVTGLDTTAENLAVARAYDRTAGVAYVRADACALPLAADDFDAVFAMDLLEHVEDAGQLVAEASRVLAPGGLFCFHTFDRNWLANLVVIHGVARFVRNAPADLHVLRLFRTPAEVRALLAANGLELVALRGARPRFRWPLWRMLATGRVGDDFAFTFARSTRLGYLGIARKRYG